MLAFLADDHVRKFPTEHLIDYLLLVYLLQIPLQLVHQCVEKLINVGLDSRIDWLSVQNEILAQRRSRVAWVL
jgi:hypothetical protein